MSYTERIFVSKERLNEALKDLKKVPGFNAQEFPHDKTAPQGKAVIWFWGEGENRELTMAIMKWVNA